MATFRKIHTTFWTDPFVETLTQEQKLFYLYLISNTKTKQCGIYEISKKYISYETGFSIKEITELITHFVSIGKIVYSEQTNEIGILNWWKYNWSESPKTIACIKKELLEVKDTSLIVNLYSTDKLSIVYPYSINTPLMEHTYSMYTKSQEEQEQEQVKEKVEEEAELEEYYQEVMEEELNKQIAIEEELQEYAYEHTKSDREDMLADVITGSLDKEQKELMKQFENTFGNVK